MKNKQIAWYLDEDILLEGTVIGNLFLADRNICGFDIQEFDEDMIDKEIFLIWKKHFPFAAKFRSSKFPES